MDSESSVTSLEDFPAIVYKIPFHLNRHRNEFFTGQDSYLEKIKHACISSKVVILHGLEGIGKTQLALEYAYRYQSIYTSVFWVNCSSEETVIQGFIGIAQQFVQQQAVVSKVVQPDYNVIAHFLQIAGAVGTNGEGTEASRDITINGVKCWLSMPENPNWLLILDSVDDLRSFNIRSYIPTCDHGTTIMTSRRQACTLFGKGLYVAEMAEKDGLDLLLKISKQENSELQSENTAIEIVRLLGCLPLAIDQAAAYIATQRMSLARYLDIYRRNKAILGEKVVTATRIHSQTGIQPVQHIPSSSAYITWNVSFKTIEAENSIAIELLEFFAFIANDNIRKDFIYRFFQVKENDTRIDDAIGLLVSYSLIKKEIGSDTISDDAFVIHPLVHAWTFDQLGAYKQVQCMIKALRRVSAILVTDQSLRLLKALKDEQQLLHHIEALCANFITVFGSNIPMDNDIFHACETIGIVLYQNTQNEKALQWYKRALHSKQEDLENPKLYKQEKEDQEVLGLLNNIAVLFDVQGENDKAQKLYEQALLGQERVLGKEHPDTLKTLHNLAVLFYKEGKNDKAQKQGQFDKAQKLFEQALAGQERVLGKEHRDTLETLHYLALTFYKQGQNDKAQKFYEQALLGQERVLGKEHRDTLETLHKLALTFHSQGQNDKAQKFYEQALAGQERVLGKEHPDTLTTLHNLAVLFKDQGQKDKAQKLYEQVIASRERVLGKEHLDTLDTVYNLAASLEHEGRYDESFILANRALMGSEKVLGKDHLKTLEKRILFAYALARCNNQQSFKVALQMLEETLAKMEKIAEKNDRLVELVQRSIEEWKAESLRMT